MGRGAQALGTGVTWALPSCVANAPPGKRAGGHLAGVGVMLQKKSSLWERGRGLHVCVGADGSEGCPEPSVESCWKGPAGRRAAAVGGCGEQAGAVKLGGIWNQRRLLAGTSSRLCPWERGAWRVPDRQLT